jgi:zinc and cadmium transporter
MSETYLYIFGSVLIVSAISLIGIIALGMQEKYLRAILLHLVSFSAGALLGDVFLQLIPEMSATGFGVAEGAYFLGGIIIFFMLERFILWHRGGHDDHEESVHSSVYLTTVGDSLHNFIDGMVIAASFLASVPLGIATTLAVIFHEIPQEIGQFAILLHGGWSKTKAIWYNFLSALTAIAGAGLVVLFARNLQAAPSFLLAFAGASFVYIALSDIVPQLHKEESTKKSFIQILWLLAGIGLMALLLALE